MKIRPYVWMLWRLLKTTRNWPVYFLNRYGIVKSSEITYRLRNGTVIISRAFAIDRNALNDVWLDQTYDPPHCGITFNWSACRTIVDVGAHIGTFTLFAAHHAPHTRIISAEPEPSNAAMLRKNIAVNHLEDRVTVIEAGIAKQAGETQFHVSHTNSGGNSLYQYTDDSHAITVQMKTLQSIFDDHHITHCDFLKLDCEGGEYDGLYGLREETLQSIDFIAIEYHYFSKEPGHDPDSLRRFLQEHGFTTVDVKKMILYAIRKK